MFNVFRYCWVLLICTKISNFFKYENEGEFKLKEGDCVHQIPGIKHEEIEHSDDLEMLEITMPADFETKLVKWRRWDKIMR